MAEAVSQGEVWWLEDDEPFGSEPGYERPYVVVQSEAFNRTTIRTVVVCPLTTNLRLAGSPGNVLLSAGEAGLRRASVVNVSGITVKERSRFRTHVGTVTSRRLRQIITGILIVIDPSGRP